ncbi:MAG TPA: hypothetical protein VK791_04475, partial [bacterium]|nr:hypothetical protein [bacterium]
SLTTAFVEGSQLKYQLFSFVICFLLTGSVFSGTVETCARFQPVVVGSYIVQTDYWNKPKCPGEQCLSVNDQTGAFTVTRGDYHCSNPDEVAAYPSILYGSAYGSTSLHCDLPAKLSELKCVKSSWSFEPTNTGRWDAAYDIWLCPTGDCGPKGFLGGAEIMIWLDYRDVKGWKYDRGSVIIDGMNWEVWEWDQDVSVEHHKYVAYLAKTMTTSVENLDLKKFLDDCLAQGFIKPNWYLSAVEAGNEFHFGGIPFTSKSFSVSVNKDCGAKPAITPLPADTTKP